MQILRVESPTISTAGEKYSTSVLATLATFSISDRRIISVGSDQILYASAGDNL